MLGRLLATVALVSTLGGCGSRTSLRGFEDGLPDGFWQGGASGTTSGAGGMGGDGSGAGGVSGAGVGGHAANNSAAGDGGAGMTAGSSSGGRGGTGAAGAGSGGMAGFPAGQGGVGGRPGPAGEGGVSGMAGEILNPQGCATPHPFVLSIDPMGSSGSVRGWLESAAGLAFEDQLPRFVRVFGPDTPVSDRSIALWWSIGSVGDAGEGSLYFYAGDFTTEFMEQAVAQGAARFGDIDVDALDFGIETVEARTGSFIVTRNTLTGETIALRVDQIFLTDPSGDSICAAVDASWRFLR